MLITEASEFAHYKKKNPNFPFDREPYIIRARVPTIKLPTDDDDEAEDEDENKHYTFRSAAYVIGWLPDCHMNIELRDSETGEFKYLMTPRRYRKLLE